MSGRTNGGVRQPTFYIPHGGGPCFFMADPPGREGMWDAMAAFLRGLPDLLPERPRALLVISAHWECPVPTVMDAAAPPLLFDYYGFPDHTYRLTWPAPGDPALAARVRGLLAAAGMASGSDPDRGYDHGVFVPFLLIEPEAALPTVQLSLQDGLDPATHIAIGRALVPLRDEGVLIVGSGLSYHNLQGLFAPDPRAAAAAEAFDTWLTGTAEADPERRAALLTDWARAPGARASHPREEHLLPLMVAAGAAGTDPGRRVYADRIAGKPVSAFAFG
ncbi:DODA-type extradiol aromatic ring-opening family dioxygenase [Marinibaculum pumilum]|uniref:DODA-type extradiol aromatic ring-opening family dioxygenase n=1 Tax=Marinibaculum pumilum TaxID=1766165 RepID=A0ABV7KVK8_9PROT